MVSVAKVRVGQLALVALAGVVIAGCGGGGGHRVAYIRVPRSDTTCDHKPLTGVTHLTVWFHASGTVGAERTTLARQVAAFNRSQSHVRVRLLTLPEGDYDQQVAKAASSGTLPDVLDFDGPYMYNYAWSGKIKPLGSCITKKLWSTLLPSLRAQGTYAGDVWGVGTFDSGLGLYVRKSVLRRIGIAHLPTSPAGAWSAAQFTHILARLRAIGYRQPLDLQLTTPGNTPGEWYTYGFEPTIESAGGDLINRRTMRSALGYMNGAAAVRAMRTIQGWSKAGYVYPNPKGDSFEKGITPISWVGHWLFDSYTQAWPKDVAIVPLPNFGAGTVTGMGSWQWGITSQVTNGDAAWAFISYLLKTPQVLEMTQANGSIPGTLPAIERSQRYGPRGPEHLYATQLEDGTARPRPQTPAYPTISAAFANAFQQIVVNRRPVVATLDAAARTVQRNIVEHDYYRPTGA